MITYEERVKQLQDMSARDIAARFSGTQPEFKTMNELVQYVFAEGCFWHAEMTKLVKELTPH